MKQAVHSVKRPMPPGQEHLHAYVDNANATGTIHINSLAEIIEKDERSFWEFFVINNPAAVNNYLMNTLGYKALGAHPNLKDIFAQVKQLLMTAEKTGDYSKLTAMFKQRNGSTMQLLVPFSRTTQNISTLPHLWQAMNVTFGDYNALWNKYYNK